LKVRRLFTFFVDDDAADFTSTRSNFFDDDTRDSTSTTSRCFFRRRRTLHTPNSEYPPLDRTGTVRDCRTVLTNEHTGHVPRAPGFFFLFMGPPTGRGEISFFKLIILLPSQRSTVRETRYILSSEGPRSVGGCPGPQCR